MESRRDDAFSAFLDHLVWERGLARNTVEAYRRDIESLVQHLDGTLPPEWTWSDVGADALQKFIEREGAEKGLAATTRARRIAALRGFFSFLRTEGFIRENPASTLSPPRKPRNLPHFLTERQVEALIEAPSPDTPEGIRDRALLELVYGCGLRASEAATLTLDAVKFDAGLVRVAGKGSKVRHVPLGAKAEAAVRRYLAAARRALGASSGESALFVSGGGKPMDRHGIWSLLKRRASEAGIAQAASPHWLRHSFATHMLGRGAPVRVIQELLGHADISTTQIYTHTDTMRLSSVVRAAHPRA